MELAAGNFQVDGTGYWFWATSPGEIRFELHPSGGEPGSTSPLGEVAFEVFAGPNSLALNVSSLVGLSGDGFLVGATNLALGPITVAASTLSATALADPDGTALTDPDGTELEGL